MSKYCYSVPDVCHKLAYNGGGGGNLVKKKLLAAALDLVIQSIVGLTSSLRGQLVKCFTTL